MKLACLIGFEVCWFALIYWQYPAIVPVFLLWCIAFWWLTKPEQVAVVVVTILGVLLDYLLVQLGVFQFADSSAIPSWMLMLWACFALVSVKVFAHWFTPWYLALAVGAIGGPLAYWGGAKLGGQLLYADLTQLLIILAPIWGLLMIALVHYRYLWSEKHETPMA